MTYTLYEAMIQRLFEDHINPMLASHGGSAELIKVEDKTAYIKFSGGCQGCAGARMTLKHYIEGAVKHVVPDIKEVIDLTEHEEGENPFYTSLEGVEESSED